MSWDSVPKAGDTHSKGGGGLPRQRLDKVQVAFRIIEVFSESRKTVITGCRPPLCRTRSRKLGESPAMFPSAQTACSRTSSLGDWRSCTKMGNAPCSTTTRVWSALPEAMLVNTQAASNCKSGRLISLRNCTKRGTTPALITSEMGGFCSMLSSFLNCCVALNWAWGSSDISAWLSAGICSTQLEGPEGAMPMPPTSGWP
mmetsp:Transcript_97848/g.232984  ORF Transcript_97848/g.232984 Transcript_97848/m.232984 type:complete len:200 (-) Transcript_97848:192-791(-)